MRRCYVSARGPADMHRRARRSVMTVLCIGQCPSGQSGYDHLAAVMHRCYASRCARYQGCASAPANASRARAVCSLARARGCLSPRSFVAQRRRSSRSRASACASGGLVCAHRCLRGTARDRSAPAVQVQRAARRLCAGRAVKRRGAGVCCATHEYLTAVAERPASFFAGSVGVNSRRCIARAWLVKAGLAQHLHRADKHRRAAMCCFVSSERAGVCRSCRTLGVTFNTPSMPARHSSTRRCSWSQTGRRHVGSCVSQQQRSLLLGTRAHVIVQRAVRVVSQ